VARLEDAGSRSWTLELAAQHLSAALDALAHRGLERGAVEDLEDIAVFVVRRDF
jgi:geranylgeranyl pyrophosphate synthase